MSWYTTQYHGTLHNIMVHYIISSTVQYNNSSEPSSTRWCITILYNTVHTGASRHWPRSAAEFIDHRGHLEQSRRTVLWTSLQDLTVFLTPLVEQSAGLYSIPDTSINGVKRVQLLLQYRSKPGAAPQTPLWFVNLLVKWLRILFLSCVFDATRPKR